jgi:hypothetical protein
MTAHTNPEGKRRALLDTLLLAMCVLLLTACTSVIVPPEHVADPVSVFVLDHGRHSSLVLPSDAGGAVRYSYGDWEYYALNQTGLGSGLRALLWPTPAALGQQLLAGQIDADSVARQLRIGVLESFEVKVERAAVRQLQLELGGIFDGARETLHYSAAYDVHFVHHPEPYTINYNSNRMVGRWLQQLGCTITGRPVLSNWRIKR